MRVRPSKECPLSYLNWRSLPVTPKDMKSISNVLASKLDDEDSSDESDEALSAERTFRPNTVLRERFKHAKAAAGDWALLARKEQDAINESCGVCSEALALIQNLSRRSKNQSTAVNTKQRRDLLLARKAFQSHKRSVCTVNFYVLPNDPFTIAVRIQELSMTLPPSHDQDLLPSQQIKSKPPVDTKSNEKPSYSDTGSNSDSSASSEQATLNSEEIKAVVQRAIEHGTEVLKCPLRRPEAGLPSMGRHVPDYLLKRDPFFGFGQLLLVYIQPGEEDDGTAETICVAEVVGIHKYKEHHFVKVHWYGDGKSSFLRTYRPLFSTEENAEAKANSRKRARPVQTPVVEWLPVDIPGHSLIIIDWGFTLKANHHLPLNTIKAMSIDVRPLMTAKQRQTLLSK